MELQHRSVMLGGTTAQRLDQAKHGEELVFGSVRRPEPGGRGLRIRSRTRLEEDQVFAGEGKSRLGRVAIGIPPEMLPRVFDLSVLKRHQQVDALDE